VRQLIEQIKPVCTLGVDGGIDEQTVPLAVAAGANVLVAGGSVFGEEEGIAAAMRRLQIAANNAVNSTKGEGIIQLCN
jgi:ribulose-phosphate 3-epimerase